MSSIPFYGSHTPTRITTRQSSLLRPPTPIQSCMLRYVCWTWRKTKLDPTTRCWWMALQKIQTIGNEHKSLALALGCEYVPIVEQLKRFLETLYSPTGALHSPSVYSNVCGSVSISHQFIYKDVPLRISLFIKLGNLLVFRRATATGCPQSTTCISVNLSLIPCSKRGYWRYWNDVTPFHFYLPCKVGRVRVIFSRISSPTVQTHATNISDCISMMSVISTLSCWGTPWVWAIADSRWLVLGPLPRGWFRFP